jgi:purine-binding chemotaxis protein CheW
VDSTDAVVHSQYLTCRIADEDYGIGILEAREILEYEMITKVPNAPRFIRGVINLRGSVVPVVDLAIKFGQEARPLTKRTCILIVETSAEDGRGVVGLVVDAVSQVIELTPDQIEPPPSFGTRAREEHLRGLGRLGNRFVLLLALDRVLEATELMTAAAETAAEGKESAPPEGTPAADPVTPAGE